jgi:hypothetical protein
LYPVTTGEPEAVHDAAICVLPGVNERLVAAAGRVGVAVAAEMVELPATFVATIW